MVERGCGAVAALCLGDCLIARPAVLSEPSESLLHKRSAMCVQKTDIRATPKSIRRSMKKRSVSLSGLAQLSCPIDNTTSNATVPESVGESSDSNLRLLELRLCELGQESLLRECGDTIAALGSQRSGSIKVLPEASTPPRKRSVSCTNSARRPSSSGGGKTDETPALARKERIAAFEAQRRRSTSKQDAQLRKLLKVQVAQVRPEEEEGARAAKRREDYDTKRQEDIKRRRERAQEAREFISHRLQESEAPAPIVQRVLDMVSSKAGQDGLGGFFLEVTPDMVDECYEQAKTEFFMPKIQECRHVPCELHNQLRDTILRSSRPWSWIPFLRASNHFPVISGAVASLSELAQRFSDSSRFACPICLDPMLSMSDDGRDIHCNYWSAALRKNEHWNNHACGHAFCWSCAKKWAETTINQQELHIRCPAAGCKYRLWDQDLQELLSAQMYNRHQEHKHADHLKNLRSIAKHDDALMDWLRVHARPCPDCHVIVSRSEGCNAMICVCGTRFCYQCGFKKCQCSVKDKAALASIWQPKA